LKLALGTAQFGLPYGIANMAGQVSQPEAKTMLQLAAVSGIDTLDTAVAYGESETLLGKVGTQGFKLVTKLPTAPEDRADLRGWVQRKVAGSLTRLGVSDLYGLLLHRPEQLLGANGKELYQTLQDLKECGKVQKVGISIYSPDELDPIIKRFRIDLVQAPFNLVDRRLNTSGWLQRLKDESIEIHTRSAFLQGLLLMPQAAIPRKFAPWASLWGRWHNWLSDHDASAVQICLAFPLSFSAIDRVVVGADSANQLEQIIRAAGGAVRGNWPDLNCDAERLINPSHWPQL